jgi:hypothetical protein
VGLSDADRFTAGYSACMAIAAEDEIINHCLSPAEQV